MSADEVRTLLGLPEVAASGLNPSVTLLVSDYLPEGAKPFEVRPGVYVVSREFLQRVAADLEARRP